MLRAKIGSAARPTTSLPTVTRPPADNRTSASSTYNELNSSINSSVDQKDQAQFLNYKEWRRLQKGNAFLKTRVVKNQFAQRKNSVTSVQVNRPLANISHKDSLFQAVLNAFETEQPETEALKCMKRLRMRTATHTNATWTVDEASNSHGYSLLGQAVVDKNSKAIKFLVRTKASTNHHDSNGTYVNFFE